MAKYVFPAEGSVPLHEIGALLRVSVTVPLPRKDYLDEHGFAPHPSMQGYALIDTGAHSSAIDDRVMEELGIPAVDEIETVTPHGLGRSSVYNASASFPDIELLDIPLNGCLGCYLGDQSSDSTQIIMLLGRDLLRHVVLTYDGPNAQVLIQTK